VGLNCCERDRRACSATGGRNFAAMFDQEFGRSSFSFTPSAETCRTGWKQGFTNGNLEIFLFRGSPRAAVRGQRARPLPAGPPR